MLVVKLINWLSGALDVRWLSRRTLAKIRRRTGTVEGGTMGRFMGMIVHRVMGYFRSRRGCIIGWSMVGELFKRTCIAVAVAVVKNFEGCKILEELLLLSRALKRFDDLAFKNG